MAMLLKGVTPEIDGGSVVFINPAYVTAITRYDIPKEESSFVWVAGSTYAIRVAGSVEEIGTHMQEMLRIDAKRGA